MPAWIVAFLALQAAAPQAAPSAGASPTTVEGVTVQAHRNTPTVADRVRSFVASVGAPSGYDQLARWTANDTICVSVAGFQPPAASAIKASIEVEARRLKLPLGGAHCEVDVLVVGSNDPPGIMAGIERRSGPLWGRGGPAAMDREIARPAPVHWWRVVTTSPSDGAPPSLSNGVLGPPVFQGVQLTHLHKMTREAVSSVVVLVDGRLIAGVSAPALADYVAMGVFAPVATPPHVGQAPSILRLFKSEGGVEPDAPPGLTDWDIAYLKGLYDADPSEAAMLQNGGIQVSMQRDLARTPTPEPPPTR